jgi:hypothetical protein
MNFPVEAMAAGVESTNGTKDRIISNFRSEKCLVVIPKRR